MTTILFITHPEVVIDAGLPIPRWHLSAKGIERMRVFAASAEVDHVRAVWASEETKAIEAAGILAGARGVGVAVHPGLNENDRSATGFLPPAEFERLADEFFAKPQESVRGWERAVDAQKRVRAAFEAIAGSDAAGDVAMVAHGGVGTLLWCYLANRPIGREHDQPFQGHYWSYGTDTRAVSGWRPIAAR